MDIVPLKESGSTAITPISTAELRGGDHPALAELLKAVPLFSDLQEGRLVKLAKLLSIRHFSVGEEVIRKGDDSTFMLILISGRAEVYDEDNGETVPLAVLEAGSSIGELGLIDGQTRSANVRALEACQTLILKRQNFTALTKRDPHILWGLVRNLSERLRESGGVIAQLSGLEQNPQPFESTFSAPPANTAPANSALATEDEDDGAGGTERASGQDLPATLLSLGSTSFVFLTSALIYESQRNLRLLLGKSSLGQTLEQQGKILAAVTDTIEEEMDPNAKKAHGRLQDLLGSLASLLDN